MKLNLGAGDRKIEGFASVDIRPETNPDYLTDLESPNSLCKIDDNSVDEVYMGHIYEHIKNIKELMKEIYRVCKDKASVKILCPYWTHASAVEDPGHVRLVADGSMMYWDKEALGSDGTPVTKDVNFKVTNVIYFPAKEYADKDTLELNKLVKQYMNVVAMIAFELEVRK